MRVHDSGFRVLVQDAGFRVGQHPRTRRLLTICHLVRELLGLGSKLLPRFPQHPPQHLVFEAEARELFVPGCA